MKYHLLRGLRFILIGVILSAAVVGCSSVEDPMPPTSTNVQKPNTDQSLYPSQPTYNNDKPNQTEIASNTDSNPSPSDQQEQHDHPFDRDSLHLKGIHLHTSAEDVTKIWGEPLTQLVMDDQEPIYVMEYEGFSIGCDQEGNITFIEVSEEGMSTGITGLHIGDSEETALEALGEPDQHSGYVMRYISNDEMLRLDLDPKTGIVRSVKLFPYQDKHA